MADKPDTKKERRAAQGSHKYDAVEHKKRAHVKCALGASAKAGFLRCAVPRSINFLELQVWLVDNVVALREMNQDRPMDEEGREGLDALKKDMATFNEYKVVGIKEAVKYLNELYGVDHIQVSTTSARIQINGVMFMVNTHTRRRTEENGLTITGMKLEKFISDSCMYSTIERI